MTVNPGNVAVEAIEAFVELHRKSRRRALNAEDRRRQESLDAAVRDAIEGARPAPKAQLGSEAQPSQQTQSSRISRSVASRSQTPPPQTATEEPEITIKADDIRRMNRVDLSTSRRSNYTPSKSPPIIDTYYDYAVSAREPVPTAPPSKVVNPTGDLIELSPVTKDLWNIGGEENDKTSDPPPLAGPRTNVDRHRVDKGVNEGPSTQVDPPTKVNNAQTPRPSRVQNKPAAQRDNLGPPALVHLRNGGTRRGLIARFDSVGGRLLLKEKASKNEELLEIRLEEVLAIFFGRRTNAQPSPKNGVQVEVTLINDKRLEGFSRDYRPNGIALTIVPRIDRSGVDRVWVPAWAVRSITTA